MLTSQDGRCELILEVEKYGNCLNALKALVDRRRDVRVRCEQEGCHCFQESRRASSVLVSFTNDCFPSPFNRTDWRRQPTKCMEHMTACVRSHCNSSPKAAAPLVGGSQSVVAQPRRSDHVIVSPSPHASKTGEGGHKSPPGPCRKSPLPAQPALEDDILEEVIQTAA